MPISQRCLRLLWVVKISWEKFRFLYRIWASWLINHLSERHQPVIKRAKSICIGIEDEHWDDIKVLIKPCADFMVDKINERIPLVDFDDPNKRIKLYEE